jgi:hypothetical protein
MRYTVWTFSWFILLANTASVNAADPKELFGAILGQIENQIQRKQQRKFRKRLMPLWQACAKGKVDACDAAATFPLNAPTRAKLERLRDIAARRPQFEQHWYACQKMDVAACAAALDYPGIATNDRRSLQGWYHKATLIERKKERERQLAVEHHVRLRTTCLQQERLEACREVLGSSTLSSQGGAIVRRQIGKLVARQERMQAAEAARQGEQRRFNKLRSDCLTGDVKTACVAASGHSLASQTERTRFERKEDELSSLPERLMSTFAEATSGADWKIPTGLAPNLVIALCIAGAVASLGYATLRLNRVRTAQPSRPPEQPPEEPSFARPFATDFPLTGHLPADVRQVLHGS